MSARERLLEMLKPGTRLRCVENTAVPARTGAEQVVVGQPTTDGVPCHNPDGVPVVLRIPNRKNLVWLNEHTARWPLAKTGRLAKHHVTWRIERAA